MKINEVEQLVGITKRNIRFYEKEGLLSPCRNSDNGYRDYDEGDVDTLQKIKLLRKLAVPMEEIRNMQQGTLTLADGVRRHVITLERERHNLATTQRICEALAQDGAQLTTLDTPRYLLEMQQMEQEGTRFMNIKKHDTITRYLGPIAAAIVFVAMMAGIIALLVWAFGVAPEDAPPLGLIIAFIGFPAAVIIGVLLALFQRIKQIKGGEEDAAAQY